MVAKTIDQFKANLTGGGARPNQFEVEIFFPGFVANGVLAGQNTVFFCHAASLPPSTIGIAPAPFRGRFVYTAGEREFAPWAVQILNDTNFLLRNALEDWSEAMNGKVSNVGLTNPSDYQSTANVHQLSRAGDRIKSYTLAGVFPTDVAAIELSFDANNVIESFNCTFVYQYWTDTTGQNT